MSTVDFNPEPTRLVPPVVREEVSVEAALKQDAMQKSSPWRMIMGLALMVLMVSVMVIIFTATGRFNLSGGAGAQSLMPMMGMLMMASMMGMSIFQMVQGGLGGGDADEVDRNRITYAQMLNEKRKQTQHVASSIHRVAVFNNPNPENMVQMITARDRSMWQATKGDDSAPAMGSELTANPYMQARIGVGLIELDPKIQSPAPAVIENTEPVSAIMLSRFLSLQGVVANAPIAWELEAPGYGFRGEDREARLGLVRSMILSLAYNHSPTLLSIGVVTDQPEQWNWMKWLPHTQNRYVSPTSYGFPLLAWDSMNSFTNDFHTFEKSLLSTEAAMVVVVDLPDSAVEFPAQYPTGYPNTHLLIPGATDDTRASEINTRFHIHAEDGMFSCSGALKVAKADYTSLLLSEEVARALSPLRPTGFEVIEGEQEAASEVSLGDLPDMYEVLGITDLERWDVMSAWRKSEPNASLKAVIGYKLNKHDRPTGELATLDVLQIAGGKGPDDKQEYGTGPHGAFQGGTGTGKSFMLKLILLMMCAMHSPAKLNFILADFKGGSTFFELGRLPHVLANISNLEDAQDLVSRTEQVIKGELQRRQEIFSTFEVVDIIDYRKKQATNPNMPNMPTLMFVADELAEFLKTHPEYVELFERIGRVGRSLGVYMFIGSQVMEPALLRSTVEHLTYGISLKVKSASGSRAVIGTDAAVNLPPSKVALFRYFHLQDEYHDRIITFDHGKPYLRRRDVDETVAPMALDPEQEETLSTAIEQFSLISSRNRVIEDEIAAAIPHAPSHSGHDEGVATGKTMFSALVDHIYDQSQGQYDVYQMWLTSMKVPMTLADTHGNAAPDPDTFTIRIGDIDDPFNHRRIPMEIDFDKPLSSALIVGDAGTGKTTTLLSFIGSSAMRYPGNTVSWYLYDYAGTTLSAAETFPNVGAYITRNDDDGFGRLIGEMRRIISIRMEAFNAHRITSVAEYLRRKSEFLPNTAVDPYGRFMCGFDGFNAYMEDLGVENPEMVDTWISILRDGSRVGVHVVATATKMSNRMMKVEDFFKNPVMHAMAVGMESMAKSAPIRNAITQIPAAEPGRLIDATTLDSMNQPVVLQARALVPIMSVIPPSRYKDKAPIYDRTNHGAEIRQQGEAFSAGPQGVHPALPLTPVPERIPFLRINEGMDIDLLRSPARKDRELIVGIDRSTALRVAQRMSVHRNMIVAGDLDSGVTTTLRTYINAITQAYSPDEASIIILDGTMGLIGDVEYLVSRGYMKQESHAMDKERAKPIISKLGKLLASRAPSDSSTSRDIKNRTFFQGKEVFVIIDGFDAMKAKNSYSIDEGTLEWLGAQLSQTDLGVHFFVGTLASQLIPNQTNKFLRPLVDSSPTRHLLLSGPASTGVIWPQSGIRFRPAPPGRAQWVDPVNPADRTTVQIAFSEDRSSD